MIAAHGDGHLEELTLCDTATGTPGDRATAGYLFVFIGAAPRTEWLERRRRARPQRVRPDRAGPAARTGTAQGLAARPRPVLPRDERARRVRGGRRARQLGQAGRLGGRRGRDGDPARSTATWSTDERRDEAEATSEPERLTPDELRSLFLFEALDDDQLAWLAERGGSSSTRRRHDPRRGRRRPSASSCCSRGCCRCRAGSRAASSSCSAPTTAAPTRARSTPTCSDEKMPADVPGHRPGGDRLPDASSYRRPTSASAVREWFPMAAHLLEGVSVQGFAATETRRPPRATGRARHGDRRADPRAQQPRRRGRAGDGDAARARGADAE